MGIPRTVLSLLDELIADLSRSVVDVEAAVRGGLGEALTVVQRSPVSALLQDALASAGWVARAEPAWPDDPASDPAAI